MADRRLVLAVFPDEASADVAAVSLKDSGIAHRDAMGILAVDSEGKLKQDKVGSRSTAKGAGVGALLTLLGPVGIGAGLAGGAAAGALHHKGLGLDDADKDRLTGELAAGKAAVGVLASIESAGIISDELTKLGGTPEDHGVSEEALETAGSATAAV